MSVLITFTFSEEASIDLISSVPSFVIKMSPTFKVLDSTLCFLKVSKGSIAFHPSVVLNGCSAVTNDLLPFIEYTVKVPF